MRGERRPRVLLLSQWYPPEAVAQPAWIARALVDRGHEVRVVTGMPHYPTGRLHPGYRWWRGRVERIDGIDVVRRPEVPYHGPRVLGRVLNHVSFAVASSLRRDGWAGWADVVLVYGSPATAATAALRAARHGLPYVLLVQDVWPDSVFASGFLDGARRGRLHQALDRFVAATYRSSSGVVVTSPGMVGLLAGRGVPREALHLVHNWVPDPVAPGGPAGAPPAEGLRARLGARPGDVVLLYAGNHGPAQGLEVVLRAMALAPDHLHLLLVGDGVAKPALVDLARDLRLPRTHFWAPVDVAAVAGLRAQADAALVSLRDAPLFRVTTPSKLQAAMAAGEPVLAVCGGDAADLVRRAGGGLIADPGDERAVVATLTALAQSSPEQREAWGRSARAYYLRHLSSSVGSSRLSRVLCDASGAAARVGRDQPGTV